MIIVVKILQSRFKKDGRTSESACLMIAS